MKRVLILLLIIILLTGCSGGGVIPSISEETQVRHKVVEFWGAMSRKDWNLAKKCCYPGSSAYHDVLAFQELLSPYPQASFWYSPIISSIYVVGNEATVILTGSIKYSYGGYSYYKDVSGYEILIKSGGRWYMYIS